MNKLDHLVPIIKNNLAAFNKPGVISVRPGFRVQNRWPTTDAAIVALTAPGAAPAGLPAQVGGAPVDVRPATEVDQFAHANPAAFSTLADHRAEFRGSFLQEFNPASGVTAQIAPAVSSSRQTKARITYAAPNVPLASVQGVIPMLCHVSPDAGWATLKAFISGTQSHLKVSMYDFTSAHVLGHFETALAGRDVQITLDDPPRNPSANQTDPVTIANLTATLGAGFASAWALVRSSPEADTWIYPTAYHIKVMVRDSSAVWLSSGNLNNSNQPDIDPFNNPQAGDQTNAKTSDRDWHVIIQSAELAKTFEAYLDNDFAQATLHAAANAAPANAAPAPQLAASKTGMVGAFTFQPPKAIAEAVTITPLLTPDPGDYAAAMLDLINAAQTSLYIQLQYIHPSSAPADAPFTALIDAVAAKIDAGKDVRIILSEFQVQKGGLEALQAAGVNLNNVKIQNNVHNKGFVFDHAKVVISSMNWSGEGVLENRDAGVIIDNASAAQYYEQVFLDDWANHAEQKM